MAGTMLIYLRNLIEKIKSESFVKYIWVFLFFNVVKLIEVLLKAVYCYCAFFVARITKTSLQNVWHLRTCRRRSKFPDRRNKNKHWKGRGLIAGCAICKIYLKMGFLYSPESRRCLVGKLKIVLVQCKSYSILHFFLPKRGQFRLRQCFSSARARFCQRFKMYWTEPREWISLPKYRFFHLLWSSLSRFTCLFNVE